MEVPMYILIYESQKGKELIAFRPAMELNSEMKFGSVVERRAYHLVEKQLTEAAVYKERHIRLYNDNVVVIFDESQILAAYIVVTAEAVAEELPHFIVHHIQVVDGKMKVVEIPPKELPTSKKHFVSYRPPVHGPTALARRRMNT
ncbi:hypothetical protein A2837_01570 [Candidatus Kaiserbacteria bacterium RIFCSPHIGHO2_01_FULL_46_22]|uniref:Uncharacterized protein n=1 Tax=Candidatus Kaiserbacteria bacterium RIFCSPHIGHO2_01_FULL_46_22 TaxID=1798475 RepID=A0A1F6BYM6_9BACT|nr:MAG: hypothetical protein A2837_01570 [Candidatus Kaiserbacteria bacterium RIFCSPHIGHO2_01_FULL_46_22]